MICKLQINNDWSKEQGNFMHSSFTQNQKVAKRNKLFKFIKNHSESFSSRKSSQLTSINK